MVLGFTYAFDVPMPDTNTPANPHNLFVTDHGSIFSEEEERALEQQLANIDATSIEQIAVLTVDSLQDYEIRHFAIEVLDAKYEDTDKRIRRVGKDGDHGIFILIAPNERQWSIEVGYDLE